MNLTVDQIVAIQELVNTGVMRAAIVLNQMLDASIRLQVPYVKIGSPSELQQELEASLGAEQVAVVRQDFFGSFAGIAELAFSTGSASILAAMLTGEEPGTPDLDAVRIGTLSEVGNIVINSVLGSIAHVLKQRPDYALPTYIEDTVENLLTLKKTVCDITILLAQTQFFVEQLQIRGEIILIFEVGSFDVLLNAIALSTAL